MMILITLIILLYLSSSGCLVTYLKMENNRSCFNIAIGLMLLAMGGHAYLLSTQIFGSSLVNIGAMKALSLTSLIMLIISMPLIKRHVNTALILILFAIVTIFLSLTDSKFAVNTQNPMLGIHILISIIAYAILLLAAIQAVLVYLRDRSLKSHSLSLIKKLPPMLRMERWLFQLVTIGFGFLTLSLLTSLFFYDTWFDKAVIHKTILASTAWVLYGTILVSRYVYGIRGKRAAKFVILSSFVLLLGITVTRVIQEVIFNYV
ncbi:cytochrome c biogenesis protein CcsA [Ignatzschineria sp. RMDPL8A]|uniref:cytochrome C assembly family protein n=1 Tax=Ignatzschineria sp. RMDPL8A TaxID=2999236 RepID=UPI00169A6D06|nr:cytochrome c biogenesis protein CcsA [Ignatzschineria sp. RMDPL8A]MDG9729073.1 cytochrome c biogenesis protein CcsA [Ignatzschineria sp. RMDPL8A]NLD08618.1 cytochrome c biogenesis protein CcsA [Xanthomonadaceae bacterium]